ncbi:MAG TPA: 50S ribosomal protein L6 [Methanosarcinales archaeon]|nr:50S ribosomal protein L6 [Methanosarcinales archaeon]
MVKEIKRTIEIPDNVDVSIDGTTISVSGPKGNIQRDLWYPGIIIKKTDSEIIVDTNLIRKKQKAMIGTFTSHIQNMITGVTKGFEYRMKVVYSHFPVQLKVEPSRLYIGNFLGEKKPRFAKILENVEVKIDADEVIITGINIEDVGLTAANIEQATRIKKRDPRVFQDGIYLINR